MPERARVEHLAVPFTPPWNDDDPRVAFRAHTLAGAMFVTVDGELVHALAGRKLTETLLGARATPVGAARSTTRVSRFVGADPAQWQRVVPAYERLSLGEPWPGIRVALAARGRGVEKIFTIAPEADVRRIAVRVRGVERLVRVADGSLVARTREGPVTFSTPLAWQDIDGQRREIAVRYRVSGNRYGFALGNHDRRHAVLIDPLLQATYIGGSSGDIALAAAVDADGSVFVAGSTQSFNLPASVGGAQPSGAGGGDAFVAKLTGDLTQFAQITYLGGSASDAAYGLALGANGAVYVAGVTQSMNFPMTGGGAQPVRGGNGDAFVAKLDRTLTKLMASTYLGGTAFDQAYAIAVAADDSVFVTGSTASNSFPGAVGGGQPTRAGDLDAFVTKLDAGLTTIVQSTYVGGIGTDNAYALALDGKGSVFVAGSTGSLDFPGTAGSAQPVAGGNGDAFVVKLDDRLKTLLQATYLGGLGTDAAFAVAMGPGGDVFVAGVTGSTNFPATAGGAQSTRSGGNDAFAAKLDPELSTLRQATYLGGLGDDAANAIAIDETGMVYIAGNTLSTAFPGTSGGAQSGPGGQGDGFVARFNPALTSVAQSSFLGGSGLDQAFALAVDARGHVYVVGSTISTNFPGTASGAQSMPAGNGDATVAELTASLRAVDPPAVEYRQTDWNHYFVTVSEDEIAKLDAGVFHGWSRTGESFKVYPLDTRGRANVCRFFSVSFAPKSSHFYAYGIECDIVRQNPDWQFEGEVFAVAVAGGDGACAIGTVPLYRLYNDGQGDAPNHRYTTSLATRASMLGQGWIPEGFGPLGVFACVPA